ncbi:tetratricopeptide repeat protein [bacterium]|nr:tetratricopeptide repeat protein [bacterium]
MPRPRARARGLAALLLVLALAGLGGCAYFNTYTNARRYLREAETTALGPDGRITPGARKAYDSSIEKCKKLMELYPDSKWVDDTLYLMSRAYFGKGEYGSCLRRLDELDERFPEHHWQETVLYMRGVSLLEEGDEAKAIVALERLQERFPRSKHLAEGLFRRGEAEYRLGNWAAAETAYGRLLASVAQSDFHDAARLKIALAQREQKQDSLAVETLTALARDGRDRRKAFEGQLTAVEILLAQRRYDECATVIAEIEPVAESFQSRGPVLLLKGRLAEARGEFDEAIALFENVVTEFPKSNHSAEAFYRIGLLRQNRQGNLDEAIKAYDSSTKEVPRSVFSDLAANKRRAVQEVLDVQQRFGTMAADSTGAERAGLQFRLAENQYLGLENPQSAIGEYARVIDAHPESEFAPQAAYAIAYLARYSLADSAAARWAVALLAERYPDSEATRFVAGWAAALGEGPAMAPALPAPAPVAVPAPAAADSLAAAADSLAAPADSLRASAAPDSLFPPPPPEGDDEP